jgi:signal transduction histidine kinase
VSGQRTIVLVSAAIAIAAACEWVSDATLPLAAGDGITGAALLGGGAAAVGVPRGVRSGALMVACGVAWLAGTVSGTLVFVHRGPLVQLVLAYPRLRPRSRVAAIVIVAAYVCAVLTPLARSGAVTLGLAGAIVGAAIARERAATGAERRARAAALAAAALIAVAFALAAVALLGSGGLDSVALWGYDAAVASSAVGLAADLRWGRWTRAVVAELVADLGTLEFPGALRDRLARALGDPQLALSFRAPEGDGYLDEAGGTLRLPTGVGGRSVLYVEDAGQPVAVLIHDSALVDDPRLLAAAASVARLAALNARLQDELRARVAQVAASRRRLVEAGIEQRQRLEAQLRVGAERRLAAVAERLGRLAATPELGATDSLAKVAAGVEGAREDLYRFAQGIHPAALTEQGLSTALTEAAARMPQSVVVDVPAGRLPASVEATIYFLSMEALANVGKHAPASHARIHVRRHHASVEVTISDDGSGGADFARGSGLRGLADRINALGGRLEIDSPLGGGTRLEATIPV